MDLLRAEGYRVVDVVEAVRLLASGRRLERVVALSFDDGYRDVAEHALPVLEQRGFRATVFVATGVIDGTATLQLVREPAAGPELERHRRARRRLGPLLRGPHDHASQPRRRSIADAAEREIAGSKRALEARLGRAVPGFCYPAGLYGERERELVARAGFSAATTCEPGANTPRSDPLALRRIAIDGGDRLADFRAKLEGGHDRPSILRAAYRQVRFRRRAAR